MTPEQAYWKALYAVNRLPEIEDIIMTHPWYSYLYAEFVINNKLPDKMHNMMILHAIEDPNSYSIKQYFKFIK